MMGALLSGTKTTFSFLIVVVIIACLATNLLSGFFRDEIYCLLQQALQTISDLIILFSACNYTLVFLVMSSELLSSLSTLRT